MRNSRLVDIVAIISICAAGILYWRSFLAETQPTPSNSQSPISAQVSPAGLGQAPSFELPRVEGAPLVYKAGNGPALITLSAVGCAGCRQRIPIDLQARQEVARYGVPVWNIFVYADANSAKAFQAELNPQADEFLFDRDGSVSVRTYGGSDASCWILIDEYGKIVYRGPSEVAKLQQALKLLSSKPK